MISVIAIGFNEEKNIKRLMEALASQTLKADEIIYVDGNSTDNTAKIAGKYTSKVYFDGREGAGAARNLGASKSKGDVLVFIDADSFPDKNWLKNLKKDFDEGCVAVGGVILPYDGGTVERFVSYLTNNVFFKLSQHFHFYQLIGSNCAYRREFFEREKGFSKKFKILEDLDMGLRMRKYGKMYVDRNAVVYSSTRRITQKGLIKLNLEYAKAYLNYFRNRKIETNYFNEIRH